MNFIKVKDDYINLDSVINISITDHDITFVFPGLQEDTCFVYHDNREENHYANRKLTTEELEQLKYQLDGLI